MQQRNLVLFIVLSFAILMSWPFIGGKLGLLPQRPAKPNAAQADAPQKEAPQAGAPQDDAQKGEAEQKVAPQADKAPDAETKEKQAAADKPEAPQAAPQDKKPRKEFPRQTVTLGSPDPDSPYFLNVELTSQGAAVAGIELNDRRYRELENPQAPLKVVGNNREREVEGRKILDRTFDLTLESLEPALKDDVDLRKVDWELVEVVNDKDIPGVKSAATFRYASLDGQVVVLKHYALSKSTQAGAALAEAREMEADGYQLDFRIEIQNAAGEARTVQYSLHGPVGLPLENADHTSKFRDVKVGFVNDDGTTRPVAKTTAALAKEKADNGIEEWKAPVRYVGIDVQYFAALLLPVDDQLASNYFETIKPELLDEPSKKSHSDVALQFQSRPLELAPQGKPTVHAFRLFAGPKRQDLLAAIQAEKVLDFGFAGPISKAMLILLRTLHDVGIPYALAIVCLTIIVRGCMFPLSKKQAAGAKRMKELQPKIAELKKKYENDREKFARAQMELFRENNYNPFSGCLPVVIQLPIFIGLYQALNNAVDLRMAPFLWIDNLAAPDALFRLPFALPFLGKDFNLLPIITVALFVVQQKMFMPPPADEQQEMQYKMMNVMMIVMGALFYHVPAGLCVYFIASSLWGMGERKLLDLGKGKAVPASAPAPAGEGGATPTAGKTTPAREERTGLAAGIWRKLLESADSAGSQTTVNTRPQNDTRANGSKKNRKTRPRR